MQKVCPICHQDFNARKNQVTCSKKCAQLLRFNKNAKKRELDFINRLNSNHIDVKYIGGYKPRTHSDNNNFKLLLQCKNTGIRFYIYASRIRQKKWSCSVCSCAANIDVYSKDANKYKVYLQKMYPQSPITFYPHKCKWCEKVFSTTNQKNKCCSKECSKKHANYLKNIRKDHRYKIAKNNGKYEDITLAKLYEKDKGICYLCGKHLILNDAYNRPEAPTIEHVIPISKGGTNTWNNVKLACRHCNNLKGTKILINEGVF